MSTQASPPPASTPLTLESPTARAWRRLKVRPSALVALAVIVLLIGMAVFAPLIAPYDPIKQNYMLVRKAPSWLHWMGTDEVGRDLLARVIWGARASLSAGVISVGIALLIGVPLGIRAQRKESTVGMAISLVVALTYYLCVILANSLDKYPGCQPYVLVWLPVVVCGVLATILVPKNL